MVPDDVKGLKVRGGSREMDLMLKAAGAAVVSCRRTKSTPPCRPARSTSAMTSSTSLITFRLEEIAKNLTTGRGKSFWFMLEPLLMSKSVFDALPKDQQTVIMEVGAEMEKFGSRGPRPTTRRSPRSTRRPAPRCSTRPAQVDKWKAIARDTGLEGLSPTNVRRALRRRSS